MTDEDTILFKDNVRRSFLKAKKEIFDVKTELNETKNLILKQQKDIENIKELILQNKAISEPKSTNDTKSSIGNRGVPMRYLCVTYASKNGEKQLVDIDSLKKDIEQRFLSLTNKEFSVFMALYQLEEEQKRPITYLELSQRLMMSIGSIRDYMKTLTFKGIPIQKAFVDGRKVSFFIQKELRDLNIASKLLSLRDPYNSQTTLF